MGFPRRRCFVVCWVGVGWWGWVGGVTGVTREGGIPASIKSAVFPPQECQMPKPPLINFPMWPLLTVVSAGSHIMPPLVSLAMSTPLPLFASAVHDAAGTCLMPMFILSTRMTSAKVESAVTSAPSLRKVV